MAKSDQILIIDPPNELVFQGPFTSPSSLLLGLTNPSDRKVCFKIKTTAPKQYCVKPNSGVIDPNQKLQIAVTLQPFEYDPAEKNRHKFMVQSLFAPDGEINQDTLWKEVSPSDIMDSKLRCAFALPDGETNSSAFATAKTDTQPLSSSPKSTDMNELNLKKTADEIKKLNQEVSVLRQENLQLKEETIRLKRQASSAYSNPEPGSHLASASVGVISPNDNALSVTYLYAALAILVLGIVVGKWFI